MNKKIKILLFQNKRKITLLKKGQNKIKKINKSYHVTIPKKIIDRYDLNMDRHLYLNVIENNGSIIFQYSTKKQKEYYKIYRKSL